MLARLRRLGAQLKQFGAWLKVNWWELIKFVLAAAGIAATVFAMSNYGCPIFLSVLELLLLSVMGAAAGLAMWPQGIEAKLPGFIGQCRRISNILLALAIILGMSVVAWSFFI